VICSNKEKTMSKLIQWLDHRMEVVGIENWKDLSEYSGLSEDLLRDLREEDSLEPLTRSERYALAVSMRVSLAKLEGLDRGVIDWIEDTHIFDPGLRGRPLPWQEDESIYWLPKNIVPEDRGTPLVGRITLSGKAEADEDWQEEWGRRLLARFGKGFDVYALEVEGDGQSVVFRNIPPWEFREGQATVYCWNGWDAQGWFGRVKMAPLKAVIVSPDGQSHEVDLVDIVRIGKVIGRWPAQGNICRSAS
jgi:hypothetical protein